ncbi:MAG TPA: TonB-dependent receptor plug domain-containing protein [Alphaproteobacteria bacterium]|nr:TonB-dependent receptor plug domain-containing protein [Alphaproteobacteria bacterium]
MSRQGILLLSSALSLALLPPAHRAAAQTQTASMASGGQELQEVVVTARRREERLQSVPIAITAFSQQQLEEKHVYQMEDLTHFTPSLALSQNGSDPFTPFGENLILRGLPGAVTYFSQVPTSAAGAAGGSGLASAPGNYFDLDHVEIDKGPQGTLFGTNAIGGAILFEPKRPTNAFEGYGQVTLGDYADHEFEGAVNIPIVTDKVLLRVAGQVVNRDGFTEVQGTGIDLDDKDYYGWRIGLTLRPTDDLENYLVYDGYWQHQHGSSVIIDHIDPNFVLSSIPIGGGRSLPLTLANGPSLASLLNPATQIQAFIAGLKAGSFSFYPGLVDALAQQNALGPRVQVGRDYAPLSKAYIWGITDVARWDAADDLTVKNIAAVRVNKVNSVGDEDGTQFPVLEVGLPGNPYGWQQSTAQFTEEPQIQGRSLGGKLQWTVGGFLEFTHPAGHTDSGSTALGTFTYAAGHSSSRSQAVYAQGTYDLGALLDGLKFTAGYRYNWDFVSNQSVGRSGSPTGKCSNIGADKNCFSGVDGSFNAPGWTLGLDYQLTPELLLYVRSGHAYIAGSTNLNAPSAAFSQIKPQRVTDVEIGAKADWEIMGIHGRTNGDLFHTDFNSIAVQKTITFTNAAGQLVANQVTQNAGAATVDGAEVEGTIIPISGVELSPHFSYVHSTYTQYPTVFGEQPPTILYIPPIQYGFTALYHLPVDSSYGDVTVSATYTWYGHQYVTPSPFSILPSYDRLDLRLDWSNIMGHPFDLAFFMTNATDNLYITGAYPLYGFLGIDAKAYGPPRMFGFQLKYRFGPDLPAF